MPDQLTTNGDALILFFTDDVYLVNEPGITWGMPSDSEVKPPSKPKETVANSETPIESESPATFQFLGSNKRNILILVNDEDNEVSDESGKELLKKIIKSINLVSADFALLNYAKHKGTGFEDLLKFFKSSLIISFGVEPAQLGLKDHPSNIVVSEQDVRIIFSHELRKLNADIAVKKALWGVLQKLEI